MNSDALSAARDKSSSSSHLCCTVHQTISLLAGRHGNKHQMWIGHSLSNLGRPRWVGKGCSPVALCFGSILFCLCCRLFLLPFVCSFHLHGQHCFGKCFDHADAGCIGSVSKRIHQTGCVLAKVTLGQARCKCSSPVLLLSLPSCLSSVNCMLIND